MKCKSCLLFFLLLTVCPRFLYARMEGMRHLGVEDGLSNNFVLAMAQDKRGCVWVATDVGLNRFDGSRFTVYKAHDSGLAGDALNTLLYDSREDVLWVGGKFGGLCAYEGRTGRFRTYEGTKDMQLWNVAHLAWAADGGIWVVPHHAAPLYFNPRTKRFTTLAEMGITLDAAEQLRLKGRKVRVVSMPCCERFDAQDADYRNSVLTPGVRARVAVEAAAADYWRKYVGLDGAVVGMGRHEELLRTCPVYLDIARSQLSDEELGI